MGTSIEVSPGGAIAAQQPIFSEQDKVRIKLQSKSSNDGVLPQGRVGYVADVNVSAVDGSVAYVVNFHARPGKNERESWAVVSEKNLMHATKTGKQISPPEQPDSLK